MKANVSKLLRSVLSMALAICLIIGMCPAAFAAEVDTSAVAGELKAALEKLVSILEAGPSGINAAIDYAKENRDEIKAEAEKLHTDLVNAADKAENLANEELDTLMTLSEALLAELQAQSDALAAQIAEAEAQLNDAQATLDEKKAELEDAKAKIPEYEAKIPEVEAEIADYEAQAADAQAKLDEAAVKLDEAQAKLDAKKAELEAAEAVTPELEAELADAQAELDAKKADWEAKQTELNDKKAQLEDAKAEFESKKAELADAKKKVEEYDALAAEYQAQIDAYRVQAEEAKASIAKVNETIAAVQGALPTLEARIEEILATRAGLKEAILYVDDVVVRLLDKLEELVGITVDATDLTVEDVANAVKTVKAEIKQILSDLEAGTTTVEELVQNLIDQAVETHPDVAAAGKIILDAVKNLYEDTEIELPGREEAVAKAEAVLAKAEEAAKSLYSKVKAYWEENGEAIKARIKNIIAIWKQAYTEATTDNYLINADSFYVALGDATVGSYVDKLAAELQIEGLPAGAYENLASDTAVTVADVMEQVNAPLVATADLITVGIGNVSFLNNAITNANNGDLNLDWEKYSGEYLNYEVIEPVFAEVYQGLTEYAGVAPDVAAYATDALEAYAYSAVAYAFEVPALIKAIRAVNNDAVVVLVGMYNPLTNAPLAVRVCLEAVVAAASAHGKAYAMLTGNAIYVDAPCVDTVGEGDVTDAMNLAKMLPSDAGHKYIQTCIFEALGYDNPYVTRVYGKTRYETALGVADTMLSVTGADKFETVIVATGKNYADALAGTYLADVKNAPILLVNDKYAEKIAAYIDANLVDNGTIYVLGGDAAVSEAAYAKLAAVGNAQRLFGKTRYETNLAILAEAGVSGDEILVCTGKGFADSLSASSTGRPILLVNQTLTAGQKEWLTAVGAKDIIILGGEAAVSEAMQAELTAYDADKEVLRLKGKTRYETSAVIANYFFGGDNGSVVLAYGENFPDALCGGALAAAVEIPVILTRHTKLTAADEYADQAYLGVVLGGDGTGIVDSDIMEIFELLRPTDITNNRYPDLF